MLPILYGIGARDYVEQLGYVLERCPACQTDGVFALYTAKRKVTFYLMPTVSVRQQQVLECRTCGARFAVPPERRDEFAQRVMSQEELSARIGAAAARGFGAVGGNGANGKGPVGPTFYQVLQVDPAADPEVIEAAFRRLSLKYHPDRSTAPDAAARMRELLEARAVLTNPQKRRVYDASLGIVRRPDPPPRAPAMRPEDV